MKFYLREDSTGMKSLMCEGTENTFGEFVLGVDGSWAFWPSRVGSGGMSEYFLREVLKRLEALNTEALAEEKTIEYFRPKTRGELVRALHVGRACEVAAYMSGSTRALIDNWLEPPPYTIRDSENKGWVVFERVTTATTKPEG